MKTKSFLFLMIAVLAIGLTGCTKKTRAELTWSVYTTPEGTEEAKFVSVKVNKLFTSYYQDLGKYTPGDTIGTATYAPRVIITGDSYDQVYKRVVDATKLADQALTEMDFGSLTKCQVVVRLFDNAVPNEIWNKDYIVANVQ